MGTRGFFYDIPIFKDFCQFLLKFSIMNYVTHNFLWVVSPRALSNKCEVVYIKEKNLDDYISETAKLEGGEINNHGT